MPLAAGASINIPWQVSIWVWDIWSVHMEIFVSINHSKGINWFVCHLFNIFILKEYWVRA